MSDRPPAQAPSLAGQVLIAMPGIGDPRFDHAVVVMCAHTPEHAMGLALNRPVDGLTVPSLLERLGVESTIELPEELVLFGGPVERERGFVLHTDDYLCADSSMPVARGVALTATREILQFMADDRRPRRSMLALGYAGWGPGQLEKEILESVWLTCDPDEALLFGDDYDNKWALALAKIGVSAGMLSSQAGRA